MGTARTVTIVVGVVLVGLIGLGAYAFAQSDGDGPPWTSGGPPWAGAGWHGERAWGPGHWLRGSWGPDPDRILDVRAGLASDLAAELDSSPEEVEAAFRAVVEQRLSEAVETGRIDQETAGEALAAYDEGDLRALFHVISDDREAAEPTE